MYSSCSTFTFQTPTELLNLQFQGVNLVQPEGELLGCELHLQIYPEQHDRIIHEHLFCLQPEFRTSFSNGEFLSTGLIYIVLMLDPEYLEALESYSDVETVAEFLLAEPLTSPLHHTDNWMLMRTFQKSALGATGYRTLWDYCDFTTFANNDDPEAEFMNMVTRFMAESTLTDTLAKSLNFPQKAAVATMQGLSEALLRSLPGLLRQDEDSTENLSGAIAKIFQMVLNEQLEDLSETLSEVIDDEDELAEEMDEWFAGSSLLATGLFDLVTAFFESENWPFEKIPGELMVRSLFESSVGTWLCLAEVKAESNQFIFYAIAPNPVPEERRAEIAELLMCINYSEISFGNFELDFEDGEFRYRNGLDFTGSQPNMTLIKNVVEQAIATMERYYPIILQVNICYSSNPFGN
ncbi:YbjN domain-containing protein [Roseofilum casamattae]|uniref:YbjN domain-containing protein n=1 Tax=Roseofilum casamattae BLCC-M143 TaxID=3022442 RepID=A0ABT7BU49_9CYAN|nr:YbjN domain-containing protein [Roseofilum casamattae]MDJ1182710.1 YbjN domain-containing protein [Roseofilum casamattae BLCC-M143]